MGSESPRPSRLPRSVMPKRVAVNNAKLIAQTAPRFQKEARNLMNYGASKRDLYRLIDEA